MPDWSAVGQSLLNGLGWGAGFAIPFFVGITYSILRILSHPTVRSIARAADKLSKGQGDFWEKLLSTGLGWLTGAGKENKP